MLTGRRFKLETSTLSIGEVDGKRVAVTIPAGNTVKVVAGPMDGDRMIDILWEGRIESASRSGVKLRPCLPSEIADTSAGTHRPIPR